MFWIGIYLYSHASYSSSSSSVSESPRSGCQGGSSYLKQSGLMVGAGHISKPVPGPVESVA